MDAVFHADSKYIIFIKIGQYLTVKWPLEHLKFTFLAYISGTTRTISLKFCTPSRSQVPLSILDVGNRNLRNVRYFNGYSIIPSLRLLMCISPYLRNYWADFYDILAYDL